MELVTEFSIGIVALLHCQFMVLEMFLWRTPAGRAISGLNSDMAANTSKLAANQGLYNGFLASGLVWSLSDTAFTSELRVFFLGCVVIAGVFGAITVHRKILFVQAVPGLIALVLVLLS